MSLLYRHITYCAECGTTDIDNGKLLSVVAALTMVLAMAVPAMAATITVENPNSDATYTAYKIFDASVASRVEGDPEQHVSYTISTSNEWFNTVTGRVSTATTYEKAYTANNLAFTQSGSDATVYVVTKNDGFSAAEFAKTLDLAKTGKTGKTLTKNADGTVSATDLETGYYFVDTTTGSLCSLLTAGTDQKLYEKNSIPSVTGKQVKNDNVKDATYGSSANGSVGDKFAFKITATTGTNNNAPDQTTGRDKVFTITDKLGEGFTLDSTTGFTVTNTTTNKVLEAGNDKDYTVTTAVGTGDDAGKTIITITLNASALAQQQQIITVDYKATLNEKAIDNNDKATNNANGQETKTYTYNFGLNKIDGSENTKLQGVKFTLQNEKNEYYVPATADKPAVWQTEKNEMTTDEQGHIDFKGIGAGNYTLTETQTLPGYNNLTSSIAVKVTASDDNKTATVTAKMGNTNLTVGTGNVITVENNKGSILPSTGGIGTTIFYVLGAALVIGAGVVLVTRRRLSK